jgi:imidazolonepropionase-like amidohydrolase
MGCVYADGADEFLRASRVELAAGADHLKVFITGGIADPFEGFDVAQMTRAEMVAVVETAAQHGTYVAAHAGSSAAIRVAIDAGIRGFEHGYHLDLSTAELMAANDCFLTPTLCVTHLPGWMERHHFSSEQIRRAVEVGDAHLESTQRAIAAGVTLVNGTDYPPGSEDDGVPVAIREIELLAGAGLSPLEALRTATTNAANLVRMDDLLGQVRVGFAADFLVVDGNPIEDVTVLRHIRGVVRGGELLRYDA